MSKKIPSLLNYARSINVSYGLLSSLMPDGTKEPVRIGEMTVRGVMGAMKTGAEEESKLVVPNIQRIDSSFLNPASDTLAVDFTAIVIPNAAAPGSCNDSEYLALLRKFFSKYADAAGFDEIGCLYAWNIANGRWLWRNRYGSDVKVEVTTTVDGASKTYIFNALDIDFDLPDSFTASADGRALGKTIGAALAGKSGPLTLAVTGTVKLARGQEVYPSQEFVQGDDNAPAEGRKSRTLSAIRHENVDHASMHPQKIGNAIRTIDIWHGSPDFGAISVEPFGSYPVAGVALRMPTTKKDLYSLLGKIDEVSEDPTSDLAHFLMANLVRGGVFSGEKSDKADKKAKTEAA